MRNLWYINVKAGGIPGAYMCKLFALMLSVLQHPQSKLLKECHWHQRRTTNPAFDREDRHWSSPLQPPRGWGSVRLVIKIIWVHIKGERHQAKAIHNHGLDPLTVGDLIVECTDTGQVLHQWTGLTLVHRTCQQPTLNGPEILIQFLLDSKMDLKIGPIPHHGIFLAQLLPVPIHPLEGRVRRVT